MTAPRVTPLVWTGRGGYFRGDGPEGSLYGVCEIIPGRWEVDRYSNGATLRIGGYRALDAAKAAAQADYETRILAALEPQDAPAMAEELVALRSQNDALMRERTSMIATHRGNLALAEKRHAAELAALRARVAELEAGQDWPPIETAPREGWFLVGVWVGHRWSCWVVEGGDDFGEDGEFGDKPTHWHPLPTPPASQEGQADAD